MAWSEAVDEILFGFKSLQRCGSEAATPLERHLVLTAGSASQARFEGMPNSASISQSGYLSKSSRCPSLVSHSEPTMLAAFAMKGPQPLLLRGIRAIHSDTRMRL